MAEVVKVVEEVTAESKKLTTKLLSLNEDESLVTPYCTSRSAAKELPPGMAAVALNAGVIYTDMLQSCFGNSTSLYQTPESWAPRQLI
ncbi:NADPH-dependent pterin aldehyde reductase-like [Nicotiana tabacum]|uniref:NADPH-dependent pterin aldehyde reductase-like n=1 Tax=Nicotiana tabacum TaxID=4097 RepID=A0AC58RLN7_TOBAC